MADFFQRLFSASGFMPHGHCYLWDPGVLWLHIVSDVLIALAYYSIPFTLIYFIRKRRDLPFNWMFLCFAIFIVSCGTTHLMEIYVIWHPVYWLQGVLKAITALVSLPTAILLLRLVPQALALPSPTAMRDEISARKKTEQKFKGLLEFAPDAIVICNQSGEITLVNSQAEKLFGHSREKLVGQPASILLPERLRQANASRSQFLTTPARELPDPGLDFFGVRKDGSEFPFEISSSPLVIEGESVIISAIRDVTERKHAEGELARQAIELRRSNLELEQYASVTSHDLREPLRTVSGYAQALKEDCEGKLEAGVVEMLDKMVDGTDRMSAMIDALLALSRIGSQKKPLEPTPLEIPLDRARQNLSVAIRERGANITNEPLPTVLADGLQMELLFQNLIGNAIKFCRQSTPQVHISAKEEATGWTFSIRDNGIGIDPQFADRIFGIFERLHSREEYPGTGIGLAICKKIVECHGGRIWLESVPLQGTTFYFTLPKA